MPETEARKQRKVELNRQYRAADPQKYRDMNKAYYDAHKESERARKRAYYYARKEALGLHPLPVGRPRRTPVVETP